MKPRDAIVQEELRKSFQPSPVRLLFIGESPPASGLFFYQADSGLYRAFRDTFAAADPSIDDANFLAKFKSLGCFLIDLCAEPVDDLLPKPRRAACTQGEPALAQTITRLNPPIIAILLRSIEDSVTRALAGTNWRGDLLKLPYPGRWARHREEFSALLRPTIHGLLSELSERKS